MRTISYTTGKLTEAFHAGKVLTIDMIRAALGGPTRMTAFRKLATLDYRTSYSHGGRYYTLSQIADYDEHGLWTYNDAVHFSVFGSLLATLDHMVSVSAEGYFAREIQTLVQVRVHNALAKLHTGGRLVREELNGEYLYLSLLMAERQFQQREQRIKEQAAFQGRSVATGAAFMSPVVRERFQVLLSALNEKQKRLYLGFESIKLGRGGDDCMARISGMNVKTIARGRADLVAGHSDLHQIRQAGAGRPSVKKNRGDHIAE
jgi:hypothetical protein